MQDAGKSAGLVRGGLMASFCGALASALAGCVDTLGGAAPAEPGAVSVAESASDSAAPKPTRPQPVAAPGAIDPALVPDPEAFSAELPAVWDGLPTLQGVWIAHPLASRARRVRLTNEETGAQVDGALFRRDPNQSGPATVISSEAAEKLGIPPDTEIPISIVAIVYGSQIMQPTGTVAPAGDAAPVAAEAPSAAASAQAAPSGAGPAQAPAADLVPPGTSRAGQPVADQTSATAVAAAESQAGTSAAEPSASDAAAVLPQPAAASAATDTGLPGPAATPEAPADAAAPSSPLVTATLQPGEAARSEAAVGQSAPLAAPLAPARLGAAGITPATSAPAPGAAGSGTAGPGAGSAADGLRFIQAGIFSQPENADRLVERFRANGLPAEALPMTAGERTLSRVLVGPFATDAERDAALGKVRAIGPADATPVKG